MAYGYTDKALNRWPQPAQAAAYRELYVNAERNYQLAKARCEWLEKQVADRDQELTDTRTECDRLEDMIDELETLDRGRAA